MAYQSMLGICDAFFTTIAYLSFEAACCEQRNYTNAVKDMSGGGYCGTYCYR